MNGNRSTFPPRLQLWRGVILSTIAEAVWCCGIDAYPDQAWVGPNYTVADQQSAVGTVTFQEDQVVGVFCDVHSPRDVTQNAGQFDWRPYFVGIPPKLLALAEQHALRIQLSGYPGTVTAVFWSDGEYLAAAEPWPSVYQHGAHVLRHALLDADSAMATWQAENHLSSAQLALVRALFERRMGSMELPVPVTGAERDTMISEGATHRIWLYAAVGIAGQREDAVGLEQSRKLLAGVGIVMP